MTSLPRVDVTAPLWDQTSFYGRFRHFFWMTNPLNSLHGTDALNKAKGVVEGYREGKEPDGTTVEDVRMDYVYNAYQ